MIELFLPPVAEVARALAASGFAHFPSCLAAPVARALGHTTRPLPEERVVCGVPGASWLEQGVPLTHALAALLVRGGAKHPNFGRRASASANTSTSTAMREAPCNF